jgi:hypothetical protein
MLTGGRVRPDTTRGRPGQDGPPNTSAPARISARKPRRPVHPAYVSLWAPAGRRRLWVYSYKCAECGTYQFGRRRDLASVTEIRRSGCGHLIEVIIARVYGRADGEAA